MLVSFARYRVITLDTTSTEAAVTAALVEAQDLVEEEVRRPNALEYGTRTEELLLDRDGRVYPHAVPIWSVPASAVYEIEDTATLRIVPPDESPWLWGEPSRRDVRGTVTYTGGWKAVDAVGATEAEKVPRKLERAIARLARALQIAQPAVPANVGAASVGDASVTFRDPETGIDGILSGLEDTLRGFRYRARP